MIIRNRLISIFFCLSSSFTYAANNNYQNLFFSACLNPTGNLAVRCSETLGAVGDLSGDSESSLNPSQALNNVDGSLAAVRSRNRKANERTSWDQLDNSNGSGVRIDSGPFSFLLNGYTTQEDQSRKVDLDTERGYDLEATGIEIGFDYRATDTVVVGGLVAWERSELEFDGENPGVNFTPLTASAGDVDRDALAFTVFGTLTLGESSYLTGSVGYTSNDTDVTRNAVFQESTRTVAQTNVRVAASIEGATTWAALNWGHVAEFGSWTVSPHVGISYSRSETDSYAEEDVNNSGLSMVIGDVERNSLIGQAGIGLSGSWSTKSALFIPQIRIDYEHEFDSDATSANARFLLDAGNTQIQLEGETPNRDTFNVGIGVLAILPNGWMPFVDYQVAFGDADRDSYRITAGLRKEI